MQIAVLNYANYCNPIVGLNMSFVKQFVIFCFFSANNNAYLMFVESDSGPGLYILEPITI